MGLFIRSRFGQADSGAAVYETLLPFADELSQKTEATIGDPDGKYFFTSDYKADHKEAADRSTKR